MVLGLEIPYSKKGGYCEGKETEGLLGIAPLLA
jgi:hypothetical protein